jgi:hypothetical protein
MEQGHGPEAYRSVGESRLPLHRKKIGGRLRRRLHSRIKRGLGD